MRWRIQRTTTNIMRYLKGGTIDVSIASATQRTRLSVNGHGAYQEVKTIKRRLGKH